MQYVLLTLAFLLEIVAFISFAFSSLLLFTDKTIQIVMGIFLFLALITFWGLFMAPKAPKKIKKLLYYISKAIIYAISAIVLFKKINSEFAITFALLALLDEVFLFRHNTG